MKTVKLFISFTVIIRKMFQKEIGVNDLATGLFCIACTKSHIMNPWAKLEKFQSCEVDWAFGEGSLKGKKAHKKLVKAILLAEKSGRLVWRDECVGNQTFALLNRLLAQNGIKPLPKHYEHLDYNYPAVTDAFKRCKRPVEVVY